MIKKKLSYRIQKGKKILIDKTCLSDKIMRVVVMFFNLRVLLILNVLCHN